VKYFRVNFWVTFVQITVCVERRDCAVGLVGLAVIVFSEVAIHYQRHRGEVGIIQCLHI
jgi:hypothetical protein